MDLIKHKEEITQEYMSNQNTMRKLSERNLMILGKLELIEEINTIDENTKDNS